MGHAFNASSKIRQSIGPGGAKMNSYTRRHAIRRATALIIGLSLAGIAAMPAQTRAQSTYPAEVEKQCRDDYYRYCSPYALGSDELRQCMEAKGKTLSSHCQQALKNAGYVKPNGTRRGG